MYYTHAVVVKLHITTLKDEVTPDDVKSEFTHGSWDYDVIDTTFHTPAEVVAKLIDDIRIHGTKKYRYALGERKDLILEVLEDVKSHLEDYQTLYEEAL